MLSDFSLEGQVAIVTGASRSIGRATAVVLAEAGAHVVVSGRDGEALNRVAAEIEAVGSRALPVICDVSDPDSVRGLVASCLAEFGPPHALVANAGIFQEWGPSEDVELEEWDRVTSTDLRGLWLTCQATGREMIRERRGSIVTISSIGGVVAIKSAVSYTAAKFGVVGLTKALAADWAPYNIRVNSVAPGFVERDVEPLKGNQAAESMIFSRAPLGRWGAPREIGLACVFLASNAASFITGSVVPVDGGWLAV